MFLADYEALAARSFDEPLDAELRAQILVCADALSQEEDPRGPLIAMEHALYDADERRAIELRKAMHEHAATEASYLLGGAASLLQAHRTLDLEWRSGRLYGMAIDARYLPRKSNRSAGELVIQALLAPAASDLRRLRVRIRTAEDARSIIAMLRNLGRKPPLEELEIYTTTYPDSVNGSSPLGDQFPNLYYMVQERRLHTQISTERGDARALEQLESCDPPTTPSARAFLGRCLTSANPAVRLAAFARVARFRHRAHCYERVLTILLQPSLGTPYSNIDLKSQHVQIIQAIAAIRPSRHARHVLAKVASRYEDYEQDARRAAGKAIEVYLR